MPGDPGFKDPTNTPWSGIRDAFGMNQIEQYKIDIHGYFLVDKRKTPHVAIFKNCEIEMSVDIKQKLKDSLTPFEYLGEALDRRKKMHLSADAEKMVVPTALCPNPGNFDAPKPNRLLFTEADARDR